jgi:hypothetical protein
MSNDLDRLRELAGNSAPKSTENVTGDMYKIRDVLNESVKPDFADIDGDGDKKEPMKKAAKDKEEQIDEIAPVLGAVARAAAGSLARAAAGAVTGNDNEENLEEISSKTLSKYAKAASSSSHPRSALNLASKAAFELGQDDTPFSHAGAADDQKSVKRSKYIGKAIDKMTTESELSEMENMLRNAGLGEEAISAKIEEWANTPGNQYEDRGNYQEQPAGETVDLSLRRYLDAQPATVKVVEDIAVADMINEYKDFKK